MEFSSAYLLAVFARSLGCALLLPGGFTIYPVSARMATALAISLALLDSGEGAQAASIGTSRLALEFCIGALIAFPFYLVVKSFAAFGSLVDQVRGQNLGGAYGGSVESEGEGQLGKFFEYGILAVLMSSHLLLDIMTLLVKSMTLLPIGSVVMHLGWADFGTHFLLYNFRTLLAAFLLFFPIGIVCILCDLLVGVVGKMVPGLPIHAEMFVVKSGLVLLVISLIFIPRFEFLPDELVLSATQLVKELFQHLGR